MCGARGGQGLGSAQHQAASLDQASLDRATLEAEVTELATAMARGAGELSFEQLQNALRVLLQIVGDWKL
jgi:hypothetical protein